MLQTEPTNIYGVGRPGKLRKCQAVVGKEFRAPVNVDIAALGSRTLLGGGRDHDQLLLQQRFDGKPGTGLRRIHHCNTDASFNQPQHQVVLETDQRANGDVRRQCGIDGEPLQQQVLPQSHPTAHSQRGLKAADDAHFLAGLLDGPCQKRSVTLKLFAGCRKCGARLVAHKELHAQGFLQALDASADGGLCHVQPLGCLDKAAGCNHHEKSAREFGIHRICRYLSAIFIAF